MGRYILSIDQGTTGTTLMLVDHELQVVGRVTREFPQIYPRPGWVEHDPDTIWASVTGALDQLLEHSDADPADIHAIGITNQRETTLLWDRGTGKPVHNAIVWQDRRTAGMCQTLKDEGHEAELRERTGLVVDPYFSGTKIRWMLDNVGGARTSAEAGDLAFGTVDSYLVWRLTGGASHITEVSNASRTLLYNIHDMRWDDDLLARLKIPSGLLPEVHDSSALYGVTRGVPGLPDGIPVSGAAGDQQAALFGQACFAPGDAKCTYGTGAFLLVNTGATPVASSTGLLTTVGWRLGGEVTYALEGSAFVAGAAVQWLRDGLGLIESAAEVETLARKVPDSGGVVVVPAFVGLGAPHWKADARGLIVGLSRGTTAAHLARATLEGIALQIHDLARAMGQDRSQPLSSFKVDGGASANDLMMQFQADILGMEIVRPQIVETTAMGAAFLAGLSTSFWSDTDAIVQSWTPDRTFSPTMSAKDRRAHLSRWSDAIARV